jgi:hypothetical protein
LALFVPDADYAGVGDVGAADEMSLQFGGGDLEALWRKWVSGSYREDMELVKKAILTVLDEFFHAVGDVEVADLVDEDDVSGLEPPVFGESVFVEFWSVPVAAKDIGSLQQQLSRL